MVENDLGVGLVYPVDERFQRLDLWLADQAGRIPLADQLSLLRQVAEAVSYAHQNRVVHRGLTPHAALVRALTDGGVRVLVGDWQSAGTVTGPALTGISSGGVTGLLGAEENQTNSPERAGVAARPVALDVDRRMAEAFQAPEGVWNPNADRIRIDVFALGALAYYVLSGRVPAADRTTLRERLNREAAAWTWRWTCRRSTPALRTLVLDATRPAVTERLPDVRAFLDQLDEAEAAVAARRGRDRPAGGRAGSGDRRPVPAAPPSGHRIHGVGPAGQRPHDRRVRSRSSERVLKVAIDTAAGRAAG